MKKMMTFALGLSLLAGSAFAAPGRPGPDARIEGGTKPAMTEVAKTAVKMAGMTTVTTTGAEAGATTDASANYQPLSQPRSEDRRGRSRGFAC